MTVTRRMRVNEQGYMHSSNGRLCRLVMSVPLVLFIVGCGAQANEIKVYIYISFFYIIFGVSLSLSLALML